MPIRKLCLKEIRLHNSKKRPARQNSTPAHAAASEWKNERSGEQEIEIEEGKRRNQEIRLVGAPELHRSDPLTFQQKDPGQNHSQQENDGQSSKIFLHRSLLRSCLQSG